VDFLLVLTELFLLGVTAEALRAIIGSKSAISLHVGRMQQPRQCLKQKNSYMSHDKGEARVWHLTLRSLICYNTSAFPRRQRRPHEAPAAHAAMLEMNNSYVRSFVPIDEQLQSGLLPQSVMQSRAARRPSARSSEHRGW